MKSGVFYELQLGRALGFQFVSAELAVVSAFIERFAAEVMPEFQAREPQHQAWEQAVLAPTSTRRRPDGAPLS